MAIQSYALTRACAHGRRSRMFWWLGDWSSRRFGHMSTGLVDESQKARKTGVIKWDPFLGGIKHHKSLAILRDFPELAFAIGKCW